MRRICSKKSDLVANVRKLKDWFTLRSHSVRAKVYPVGERLVGSRKCKKNCCQVCKSITETETLQSFADKKV